MKRTIALPLTVLLAALGCPSAGNAKNNAHQTAFAAAADNVVRASIVRIDDAELGDVANGHSGGRYGPIGDDDRFVYGHTQAKAVALDAPVTIVGSAPYTMAQAKAGLSVYAADCLSCHGAELNGGSAPAVAGTAFLSTAKTAKWTLSDLRNLVVKVMPLYVPATLTPKQYASVLAFLLASNCYPSGNVPFPEKDEPALGMVRLGPFAGAQPTDTKLGTCPVR